ncbi:agmatine deiminase family protein [Aeromicrobium sp. NPDC092404]|uniref:agmatine deiminase family protein n=1 Tax=Aeromicrobium sp. NPDC092404 TaxID=3154976 RepID=UPI0034238B60
MSWVMPAETALQDRVWMAFPPSGYLLGDSTEDAHEARAAWTAVAHAVLEFEPVTMVVDPADLETARTYLSADIELLPVPLDDAWMRDMGPTFVRGTDGSVAGVDWVFNGWGAQEWARWDRDQHVARAVLAHVGLEVVPSPLVNEGGGFHVDGAGAVLVTDTVQLDPGRNPGLGRADVEAELRRTLGVDDVVWVPRGLTRDSERFGTRGHIDIVATFPSPGVLLVHDQRDESHPDAAVMRDVRAALGTRWEIVDLPAPTGLRDAEGWVDHSYVNHLVVNGGVITCAFDDPHDADAAAILADAYPGRTVRSVDARPLFARGGGVHCITQQQPSAQALP